MGLSSTLGFPTTSHSMKEVETLFLTDPDAILSALKASKENQSVIGICSPVIGDGIFLTSVEHIISENDILEGCETIIVLKRYDIHGYFMEKNTLTLNDIERVCPLKMEFKNPFLKIAKT